MTRCWRQLNALCHSIRWSVGVHASPALIDASSLSPPVAYETDDSQMFFCRGSYLPRAVCSLYIYPPCYMLRNVSPAFLDIKNEHKKNDLCLDSGDSKKQRVSSSQIMKGENFWETRNFQNYFDIRIKIHKTSTQTQNKVQNILQLITKHNETVFNSIGHAWSCQCQRVRIRRNVRDIFFIRSTTAPLQNHNIKHSQTHTGTQKK